MAVTFDSTFEHHGTGSQASPFSYVSNAGTVTGTVGANSNRVLIVYVAFRGITSSAVSVTWNGVSMTQIVSQLTLASAWDEYLFGLINPATGAQTLSVAWTGGAATVAMGAVSLYNADQSTGWQNSGTDTGTGTPQTAASVITSANGNMAVAGHGNNNATGTSITAGSGTSAWIETSLDGNYAMAYRPSTSGSTTISWDLGSAQIWGNVKVDVIAASAGISITPAQGAATLAGTGLNLGFAINMPDEL